MKRPRYNRFKFQKVNIQDIDERLLLINLYFTQGLMLLLAIVFIWWNKIGLQELFGAKPGAGASIVFYGVLCAGAVLLSDLLLAKYIPDHVTDDGGINKKLFANRPVWHIAIICFVVAVCEELLFRGAVQNLIGAYWTSIVFAVIHVRYLRHWLMTSLVFSISYALGWVYIQTGTLLTPIIAHFIIDFVLGYYLRGGKQNE